MAFPMPRPPPVIKAALSFSSTQVSRELSSSPLETELQYLASVSLVNFLPFFSGSSHMIDDVDCVPDIAGAHFGIEGHIRSKQHTVRAEESQAALGGRDRPEERRIAVEHMEIIDGALL